jgi:hypothetical protein
MAQYKQPIPTAEDALRDAEKWNAGWDTFLKHPEAAKPRWKDEQSKIAARLPAPGSLLLSELHRSRAAARVYEIRAVWTFNISRNVIRKY